MTSMDNAEFQQHAEKIERLVQSASSIPDEKSRSIALELMQSLMDLHGAGLTRIVELLADAGESGRLALAKLGDDPLVCGLLVLYGIHPVPLEERVTAAIEKVGPQLRKQGGSVELRGISDGVVRLSIRSSGNGCHSSPDTLQKMVEQAIREAAPEVIEVLDENAVSSQSGFVPLNMLQPVTSEGKTYEESAA
jgi:Fe-S cluster biogenesis protein NfuA